MGVGEKILFCIFIFGFTVFLIGAGISIMWLAIEDTAFGRAIDEIMEECVERWKERSE